MITETEPPPESSRRPTIVLEKPPDSLLRERYLQRDLPSDVLKLLEALLLSHGFQPTLSQDGKRVEAIQWQTQEQDFQAFDRVVAEIRNGVGESDEEYSHHQVAVIYSLLLSEQENGAHFAPLFMRLNDESIVTSPAHAGTTPMQHTQKVAELLRTECMDLAERFTARLFAWTHDLGKLVIADKDYFQLHGEISFLILREYFSKNPDLLRSVLQVDEISPEVIEEYLNPVRFHHGMEMIQRDILASEEVRALVKDYSLMVWGALSIADTESVPPYKRFSVPSAVCMLEFLLDKIDLGVEAKLIEIKSFVDHLVDLVSLIPELSESILAEVRRTLETIADMFPHVPEFQEAYKKFN